MNPAAPVMKILMINSSRIDDYLWPLGKFACQTVVECRNDGRADAAAIGMSRPRMPCRLSPLNRRNCKGERPFGERLQWASEKWSNSEVANPGFVSNRLDTTVAVEPADDDPFASNRRPGSRANPKYTTPLSGTGRRSYMDRRSEFPIGPRSSSCAAPRCIRRCGRVPRLPREC